MSNLLKWAAQHGLALSCAVLCLLSVWGLAPVAQAQCVPKPSGIVAWWKAENNAVDSVGGANGTLFNGASYTTGKVGQAFTFDGVNDRINVPDVPALQFTKSFTIEGWVMPTSYPTPGGSSGGQAFIFFRGDNRGGLDPYYLHMNTTGKLDFLVTTPTESYKVISSTALPLNQFSHIAATLDDATGEMKVYLNGALSNSGVTAVRPFHALDPGSNPGIGIGNHGSFPNTPHNFPFAGRIDELAAYNRALTAAEVQDLYNAGSGGKCDVLPRLIVSDAPPVNEGTAGAPGAATFNVNLSFPITQPVTVNYATADGLNNGAVAGSDYLASSGTLTFAAGETSKTVRVNFIGDDLIEADETFFLNLSNAVRAEITQAQGMATILHDEPGPAISINDVSVKENDSATTALNFTVTLSQVTPIPVQVDYGTLDISATAPADYSTAGGTITFAPGETQKTITVFVRGDTLDEADELLRLNLSNPTNASLNDAQGLGTITDDDAAPTASIDDIFVFEANSGTLNATFTVDLSTRSGRSVSLSAITYNGTAKAPADYTSSGINLVFAPGETRKTFSVPVNGDMLNEADELFYVILSSPTNTAIARGRGIATIFDNDERPSLSIDDISIGEGNNGQRIAALRLKLSSPSGQVVRVTAASADSSTTSGNDYVALAPTQITFTTGALYAYARVYINGDLLNEPNEAFLVNLSSPLNATITDSQAVGTILNDDSAPALLIDDVSISEGNTTNTLTFTVTLSKASGQTISVNYATADGVARSTSDYAGKSGTLTFAPGSALTQTISITVNGDSMVENDETLFVLLSGATNVSIGRGRGVGTITNDDTSG